jgi:small subunit ribosomal protein S2
VAQLALKDLIQAGLHFGHAATSWNPKMAPYLFGVKKKVHIFDLKQTVHSLLASTQLAKAYGSQGKKIMFVGTKVQAQQAIRENAIATGGFYVCERWLGGMLTNLNVILRRLERLSELEYIEQEDSHNYSKKILSTFKREQKKLQRDLGGVRGMTKLPDLVVIIDPKHENNAVKESNICGIPVIALTDSNCSPDGIDLIIPGNDDAKRGIELVLKTIADAYLEGQKNQRAAGASSDSHDAGTEAEVAETAAVEA